MKSWKTTLAGVLTALVAVLPSVAAALDNDPETVINWAEVQIGIIGILAALGFIAARDNSRTSEEVGAGQKPFRPGRVLKALPFILGAALAAGALGACMTMPDGTVRLDRAAAGDLIAVAANAYAEEQQIQRLDDQARAAFEIKQEAVVFGAGVGLLTYQQSGTVDPYARALESLQAADWFIRNAYPSLGGSWLALAMEVRQGAPEPSEDGEVERYLGYVQQALAALEGGATE